MAEPGAASVPPLAGPADITHRRVMRIAAPILLANITVPVLGAVDTAVVGQLGEAAPIGAVGIGAVMLSSIYWVFAFLRMGTTGLAAQAHGQGDATETAAILMRALAIAAAAGLGLIALQVPLTAGAFALAPASDEVEGMARSYLVIRIWGAPATIALYAVTGWLIATERTGAVLGLQLWINGLNIGLDLWFVLGLGWGVEGVAVATLVAEWSGLALGLWICRGAVAGGLRAGYARLTAPAPLRRMLTVNSDIMIRSVLLKGSLLAFVFLGAGFGDDTLAANQVLFQFVNIVSFALDGFAFAAEALVGQAAGARSARTLGRAVLLSSVQAGIAAVLLATAFALLGPKLIDIMVRDPTVQAVGREFLPWVVLLAVASLAPYMYDGFFIGTTATREMRNTMLAAAAIYAGALFVLPGIWGNHGLWASFILLNVTRGIGQAFLWPGIARRAVAGPDPA